MGLIQLAVYLVVFGTIWGLATMYLPIPPPVKMAIHVICTLLLILFLASAFGLGGGHVPSVRW